MIRKHMQELMVPPLNAKGKEYLEMMYPPAVYEMNKNRLYDIFERVAKVRMKSRLWKNKWRSSESGTRRFED